MEIMDKDPQVQEAEQLRTLQEVVENQQVQIQELSEELEQYKEQLKTLKNEYETIAYSTTWRMTKPFRLTLDYIKLFCSKVKILSLAVKTLRSLKREGIRSTLKKVKKYINRKKYKDPYTKEVLERQRHTDFPRKVKFSIVVPLYNTPEKLLHEMIRSVMAQTYDNWELCMADGSDAKHTYVGEICREYQAKDARIRYKKLEKNRGISGNTNACLEMTQGNYIGLFDHDDLLHPAALFEVMEAICDKNADFIYTDEAVFHKNPYKSEDLHFKSDYAPDTLRSVNYICHFTCFSRKLLDKVGGFRPECDGSQDYDIILRLTEQAQCIVHIPKILYFWRAHKGSVAGGITAKPYTIHAAHRAIADHLERTGLKGKVEDDKIPSMYRIQYELTGLPLISILIPNYEHMQDLKKCLDSIYRKSTYKNFEIIVIENNSHEEKTFAYYEEIQRRWSNLKVVVWEGKFNYSAINNFGARYAKGEYLLLLNNDIEVITPDWLQEMLMYAQRSDVGAVGAKLLYVDDTIQHGGVILGISGFAGHSHRFYKADDWGFMGRLTYAQNLTAVTAACAMIRRDVWNAVNGLDESFEVALNDVDLCLRIRKAGYLIVWTPFAELYHYESKSRGYENTEEKQQRFSGEVGRFQQRWEKELAAGDPYYNPNLTLEREDFTLR